MRQICVTAISHGANLRNRGRPRIRGDFYRKNLTTLGWQSTMDHTVAVEYDKPTVIFRNPAEDILRFVLWRCGGKLEQTPPFVSKARPSGPKLDRKIKERAPALVRRLKRRKKVSRACGRRELRAQSSRHAPGGTRTERNKPKLISPHRRRKGKGKTAVPESLRVSFAIAGLVKLRHRLTHRPMPARSCSPKKGKASPSPETATPASCPPRSEPPPFAPNGASLAPPW